MFALIALILFVLAFFHVHPAGYDLVVAGLAFLALHFLFDYRPWGNWRNNP